MVVVVVVVEMFFFFVCFSAHAALPADSELILTAPSHYFPSCVKCLTHQIIITAIIREMRWMVKNRFRN